MAENYYCLSHNANTIDKINHLQKALSLYPFTIKYHVAYAILMRKQGDIETAEQHEKLASGLKLARKKQIQLGISGSSVYRAALIQYYTGMFHDWNKGYSIASDLINSYRSYRTCRGFETLRSSASSISTVTYSKIANSPHSSNPKVFAKSLQNYKPKSNNARRQWPGANAALSRRGAAAIITFFVMSFAGLHASASENSTKPEIVLQENVNCLLLDSQIVEDANPLLIKQLHATTPDEKIPFGLDRIALFLLLLPLVAFARSALSGKSKLLCYILISSIFALGINTAVQGQAASGWGMVKDNNNERMNQARVTYIMAENELQCLDVNTLSDGMYFFNNIDLITTNIENKPTLEELTTYIGTGQDHNINIQTFTLSQSKGQPTNATMYNMLGQPITTINPEWDGELAHYYWDGSVNGQELPVGSYIFTTAVNGEQFTQKVMQLNNGSFIGDNYQVEEKNLMNNKSSQTVEKKFYVELTPDPNGDQFLPQVDTVWLHEGTDNEVFHYVEPIPATIDQYFKLVDSNTREGLENFTIRARDTDASGEILDSSLTNANGIALLENIPEDALLYLEYGPEFSNGADTSYYSSKGNKWQMLPDTWFANDTISPDTVKLALPNKNLIIPQTINDPAPATIWTPASYIRELVGYDQIAGEDFVNIEQACRNEIRIWIDEESFTSLQLENMENLLQDIDSLFYGTEQFTYTIVEDSINTENLSYMSDYHHSENYYPGELGYNIRDGPGHVSPKSKSYNEFIINEQNTDNMRIILGGNIWTSTYDEEFIKETVMRLNEFQNVTSRPSFGNLMPTYPNYFDRAITRTIRVNHYNRVSLSDERVQSFSLEHLQDYFNE
ncbi:MAG: hypothetical protein PHW82_01200 [Bacteroidales bacterium]|nr:hypothetical protein [Bacteroidales bacterium]